MADIFVKTSAEEGRFGFGTTEAVDSLIRRLNMLGSSTTVTVAINVDTMIRNAVSNKSARAQDVVDKVRRSMNGIATEICEVCQQKWRDRTHHVVFYHINSDSIIPVQFKRPKNLGTDKDPTTWFVIDAATQLFLKIVKPNEQTVGNCTAHFCASPRYMKPTYKGIREVIDGYTRNDSELHLISHFPMDYHVTIGTSRQGCLYRSHTGEAVAMTPDKIGKIVFKNDCVPFYPKTHVLLGDKYLLKQTLNLADKKRLLALAEQGRWAMHTNTYVSSQIRDNNFVLPYSLD